VTSPGSLDDSLRRAFREAADEVPADSVPPLILPPPTLPARRRRAVSLRPAARPAGPRRGRTRTRAWAAVTSSAVLAAGVLAAAAGMAHVLTGHQEGRPDAAVQPGARFGAQGAPAPAAFPTPVAAGELGVPAYYLALTLVSGARRGKVSSLAEAVVRVTRTGQMLATVGAPRPYRTFTAVTAAADDRTFVLAAQEPVPVAPAQRQQKLARSSRGQATGAARPSTRLFVLRLDPAGAVPAARPRLTALPVSYVPDGAQATELALSPDGTRLAVSLAAYQVTGPTQLRVIDLATGALRAWSATACQRCGSARLGLDPRASYPSASYPSASYPSASYPSYEYGWLSWAADDRTLAFVWTDQDRGQVRFLDTAKSGTDLVADSRIVVRPPRGSSGPYWREVLLTPDARRILAVTQTSAAQVNGQLASAGADLVSFSPVTGKQTSVLNRARNASAVEQVLWTDASGSTLLVTRGGGGADPAPGADIVQDGRDTPIPWPGSILDAAW
jgi:hypothetical protein